MNNSSLFCIPIIHPVAIVMGCFVFKFISYLLINMADYWETHNLDKDLSFL